MLKKAISLLLVVLLVLSTVSFATYAEDLETPVQDEFEIEEYETISGYSLSLTSVNHKAKISIRIYGSNSQFQNGTLKLYKYESGAWSTVKTWTNLSSLTNTFLFNDNTVAVQSGAKYKVKIAITAYTSTTSERIVLDTIKTL
ncbi:MAG: hypothetical protein IKR49_10985 [Clostridia bacterium]|nr:hypothetical protein [Clostridia bacterium]